MKSVEIEAQKQVARGLKKRLKSLDGLYAKNLGAQ
jgi:hypothetical protein